MRPRDSSPALSSCGRSSVCDKSRSVQVVLASVGELSRKKLVYHFPVIRFHLAAGNCIIVRPQIRRTLYAQSYRLSEAN